MVYVKQVIDNEVVAVLSYDYEPKLSEDSCLVVITEEEYNELLNQIQQSISTQSNPIAELQEKDRELNAQVQALTTSQQFLEDCIVEMAEVVYA